MRWCRRCVLPDTRPNLTLDADGRLQRLPQRTAPSGKSTGTRARRALRRRRAQRQRRARSGYDCLIPVSGGKDSTWQTVKCLEHGLKPLAVTWRTPGRTAIGQRNLDNLIGLGVDHIDYSINPQGRAQASC